MKKLTLVALLILFITCQGPVEIPQQAYHDDPNIQEKVIAILEENSEILSDSIQLSQGVYEIEFSEDIPNIAIDDIIVGNEGKGFLKKVTSTTQNGNIITIETTQANLEDLFTNSEITFSSEIGEGRGNTSSNIVINHLAEGVTASRNGPGLVFDFSNTTIYADGPTSFVIDNGNLKFNPNFNFDLNIENRRLQSFSLGAENANLELNVDVSFGTTGSVNLSDRSKILADYDRYITLWVGFVPVVIVINTKLEAKLNVNLNGGISFNTGFKNESLVNIGVSYTNQNWIHTYETANIYQPKPLTASATVDLQQKLSIIPKISFDIYNVTGPYLSTALTESFSIAVNPNLDWNSELKVGVDPKIGVAAEIFGNSLGDFYVDITPLKWIIYKTPTTIEVISGNNQTGNQGQELEESLIIKVTDTLNLPVKNVPVYFIASNLNGSVNNEVVTTDENGLAEVKWTLGTEIEEQTIVVKIKNANGSIANTLDFTATAEVGTIELIGNLSFGSVAINSSVDRVLTIKNNSFETINVTSINLPNGYTSNWTSGSINAEGSQEVVITFSPTEIQEYNGEITVNNALDNENNTLEINGEGIEEAILLTGIWITAIEVVDCTASGFSNDQTCANHTSWDNMEMELSEDPNYNYCVAGNVSCGYVYNQRFVNSEVMIERSYNFDGSEVFIKIRTYSTS